MVVNTILGENKAYLWGRLRKPEGALDGLEGVSTIVLGG